MRDILSMFERANIEVAKLCNHQKKVVKSLKTQLQKMKDNIDELKKKKRKIQTKKKRTETDTKRINKINDKIKEIKGKIILKNELKSISLTTSKVNYIDPRIVFAFSKKMNVDIDKLYNSALQEKFNWASTSESTFEF